MLIAQALNEQPDSWVSAVQAGGTAGLIAFLLLTVVAFLRGWVISGSSHRESITALEKELSEQKAENREQRLFLRDQAAPLLDRNARILEKVVEAAWTPKNPPS